MRGCFLPTLSKSTVQTLSKYSTRKMNATEMLINRKHIFSVYSVSNVKPIIERAIRTKRQMLPILVSFRNLYICLFSLPYAVENLINPHFSLCRGSPSAAPLVAWLLRGNLRLRGGFRLCNLYLGKRVDRARRRLRPLGLCFLALRRWLC